MALFVDGLVSETADLIAYEADLKGVAASEEIDLKSKATLAQTEVGAQLEASSRRPGHVYYAQGSGWQSTGAETALPRFDLGQVVVTPPLKLWHTFQTLSLIYRDANSRRVADKYLAKWREYKELSKWAQELLFQTGVGLTNGPIPRPAEPQLGEAASTLGSLSLWVRMSWTAGAAEGAGSAARAVKTAAGKALVVTPPTAPAGVTGWHVYVGESEEELQRQNSAVLAVGSSWTMPDSGLIAGEPLGEGQKPDVFRTVPRFLQRG